MNQVLSGEEEPRLLQLLTDAQSSMARLFEYRARHLGLTRPQWRIIAGLHGHAGVTQTELSDITAIARSPLGKTVDQLEIKGYLERRSDPDDRRINRLYLTDTVTPLLEPATELAHELQSSVLAGLPDGSNVTQLLAQLVAQLQTMVLRELNHPRLPAGQSFEQAKQN